MCDITSKGEMSAARMTSAIGGFDIVVGLDAWVSKSTLRQCFKPSVGSGASNKKLQRLHGSRGLAEDCKRCGNS